MNTTIDRTETETEPTQEELDRWADEQYALIEEQEDGRAVMEWAAAGGW